MEEKKPGAEQGTEPVLIRAQECVLSSLLFPLHILKLTKAEWKRMLSKQALNITETNGMIPIPFPLQCLEDYIT